MDNEYSPEVDQVSGRCSNEYDLLWRQRCLEELDPRSKRRGGLNMVSSFGSLSL